MLLLFAHVVVLPPSVNRTAVKKQNPYNVMEGKTHRFQEESETMICFFCINVGALSNKVSLFKTLLLPLGIICGTAAL